MDRSSPQCSAPGCSFNDLSVNCRGSCRQPFHAVCVGLSAASVPAIASSSSYFWFCDICRDHIRTGRTTVAVRSETEAEKRCGSTSCFFTDQLVTCDGPCGKDFHGMCVKLSKTDLAVIGLSSNIVWFCAECKLDAIPAVDQQFDGEPDNKDVNIIEKLNKITDNLEIPPDSLLNSNGNISVEAPDSLLMDPEIEDRKKGCGTPDSSTDSDGNSNNDDSPMKDLENVEKSVETEESPKSDLVRDSGNGTRSSSSSSCSSAMSNNDSESGVQSNGDVFTFGAQNQSDPSFGIADLNPVVPVKAEKDNSSVSKKRPLNTDSSVEAIAPKTAKKNNSIFSLFIRFNIPNMSVPCAEKAVRNALALSHKDPIIAWNVVPYHVAFPSYSTFRVDLDARWKSAALASSTWRSTANYMEHREWYDVKIV